MTAKRTPSGQVIKRLGHHDLGCRCYPHVSEDEAVVMAVEAARQEYVQGVSDKRRARALLLDELEAAVRGLPTWDKRTVPGGFHVNRAEVLALIQQHREAIR